MTGTLHRGEDELVGFCAGRVLDDVAGSLALPPIARGCATGAVDLQLEAELTSPLLSATVGNAGVRSPVDYMRPDAPERAQIPTDVKGPQVYSCPGGSHQHGGMPGRLHFPGGSATAPTAVA